MNEFMPEAEHAVSPEALADLKMLMRDHGINAALIKSLKSGKEEARAHLQFFKRMMYLTNGGVIFLGLVCMALGARGLMSGFSFMALIGFIIGALLFVKFSTVFIGMLRSIGATEAVARKHELI